MALTERAQRWIGGRTAHLSPTARALLWSVASGLLFCMLNATMRGLTLQLPPLQAQFMRYLCGALVMLPLVLRAGPRHYWPNSVRGQFTRGGVHTLGLVLWFMALPMIPLADTTAIGFTTPLFTMIGAAIFLREHMRWERWLATVIGFGGVLVVLAPKLGGSGIDTSGGIGGGWHLLMLASAPVFAVSYLITKVLTRTESAGVIVVWQAISVSLFSLPMALWVWQTPTLWQWLGVGLCGVLGSSGHYCLTRSFRGADISSTQSVKFLDLVWASLLGWLWFADLPTQTTLLGGAIICGATLWAARREQRRVPEAPDSASP